jgi:hypothetical protein
MLAGEVCAQRSVTPRKLMLPFRAGCRVHSVDSGISDAGGSSISRRLTKDGSRPAVRGKATLDNSEGALSALGVALICTNLAVTATALNPINRGTATSGTMTPISSGTTSGASSAATMAITTTANDGTLTTRQLPAHQTSKCHDDRYLPLDQLADIREPDGRSRGLLVPLIRGCSEICSHDVKRGPIRMVLPLRFLSESVFTSLRIRHSLFPGAPILIERIPDVSVSPSPRTPIFVLMIYKRGSKTSRITALGRLKSKSFLTSFEANYLEVNTYALHVQSVYIC